MYVIAQMQEEEGQKSSTAELESTDLSAFIQEEEEGSACAVMVLKNKKTTIMEMTFSISIIINTDIYRLLYTLLYSPQTT